MGTSLAFIVAALLSASPPGPCRTCAAAHIPLYSVAGLDVPIEDIEDVMRDVEILTGRTLPDGLSLTFVAAPFEMVITGRAEPVTLLGVTTFATKAIIVAMRYSPAPHYPRTRCVGVTSLGHELLHVLFPADYQHHDPSIFGPLESLEMRSLMLGWGHCTEADRTKLGWDPARFPRNYGAESQPK